MKRYSCFLFLSFSLIFLTGCWSYREIDKLSLLAGVAVDREKETGEYDLTAEIIDVNSPGKNAEFSSLLLGSKAKSVHDASRSIIAISARQLFWSHATSVIISEDIAKDGILHILDWLARDYEPRLTLYLFVAQTNKAKDILNLEPLSNPIRSFEISTIIESSKKSSMAPNIEIYELINQMAKTGIDPVVPTVKKVLTEGHNTMDVSGGAVIKNHSFVGYIDEEEIKSYLLGSNKFKGGLLIVDISHKNGGNATIKIFKSSRKIKPIMLDNNIKMHIKIKAEAQISTVDSNLDLMKEKNILKVKALTEKKIKDDILKLIKKMQLEYSADIFGFGEHIKGSMPDVWKKIEPDWDSIYKDLQVDVDVDVHIRGTGHFSKTRGM